MAKYMVVFTKQAAAIRDTLDREPREALQLKVKKLARNPEAEGNRQPSGTWTGRFGNGYGLVEYEIEHARVIVTLLDIVWPGL